MEFPLRYSTPTQFHKIFESLRPLEFSKDHSQTYFADSMHIGPQSNTARMWNFHFPIPLNRYSSYNYQWINIKLILQIK